MKRYHSWERIINLIWKLFERVLLLLRLTSPITWRRQHKALHLHKPKLTRRPLSTWIKCGIILCDMYDDLLTAKLIAKSFQSQRRLSVCLSSLLIINSHGLSPQNNKSMFHTLVLFWSWSTVLYCFHVDILSCHFTSRDKKNGEKTIPDDWNANYWSLQKIWM